MSEVMDVVVAAYQDLSSSGRDFDALVQLVKDKAVSSEGVIRVDRDADGHVTVTHTGDHLGRKGLGWGGGVGLVVGLFSPPLLASVVVGGAVGSLVGRFAKHKVDSGLEAGLGDKLQPGTAVVIAIVDEDDRLAAERALAGSLAKSVVPMDKKGLDELKAALAEAAGKFNPDRTVLPIPDRNFGGTMGRTIDQSVPDWSMVPGPKAPDDAPNVLICLIDDAGFGQPDTFGGPISTPNLTRVQKMGLTYNRFHVTALCSPTRAALLTGRNHHRVGFGSIAEYPGLPGLYRGPAGTCTGLPAHIEGERLRHRWVRQVASHSRQRPGGGVPFDHWPQSWGFDHWWGFLSGAAGQYDPIITQDNSILGVPKGQDAEPYYFPDDLTDKAVEWLHGVRRPGRHQAVDDVLLDRVRPCATPCGQGVGGPLQRQVRRRLGPATRAHFRAPEAARAYPRRYGTDQTARLFPAWGSLSEVEKKLYARQMEVFAGFSENADWNVGRLLDAIAELGDLDNTLVFYVWGDNGSSMEGTITGSFNEMTFLNGVVLDPEQQLKLIDEYGGIEALGSDHTAPHFAAAWAHAGNTPFQWGKQMASHLGGTRNPMVIAWPARVKSDGEVRTQFTHCIDIAPTVLDAIGLPEPTAVDGISQEPMDGTSFLETFSDAHAAERHTVQYFEFGGARAIYHEGWWACARLDKAPWDLSPATLSGWSPGSGWDPDADAWELYYLPDDFSQAHDLAAEDPLKLRELKELWWQEAERNRALPLLGCFSIFFGLLPPLPTVTRFSFSGDVQNVQRGMVPRIAGRSYAIEAELEVPDGGVEGVIVANADFIGGFGLWVDDQGRLNHTYSFLGVETYKQTATEKLPTGDVTVKMLFAADAAKPGTGGVVTLWANDKVIGEGKMPHTVPVAFSSYAGMDIGRDNGLVVDRAYEDKAPYAFTGTVKRVVFDLKPATHENEQALHQHAAVQAVGQGAAG